MLSNYQALSAREIEVFADSITALAEADKDVADDISQNHLSDIYYFMATGRYAEAMPLLRPYLDENTAPLKKFNRHKFYRMLEEAAEATGDSTTLLATARLRNKMLEQLLKSKSEECYRELSVLYEVDKLKSELEFILKSRASAPRGNNSKWNRVYISRNDLIFPFQNQKQAWKSHNSSESIIEIDAPH